MNISYQSRKSREYISNYSSQVILSLVSFSNHRDLKYSFCNCTSECSSLYPGVIIMAVISSGKQKWSWIHLSWLVFSYSYSKMNINFFHLKYSSIQYVSRTLSSETVVPCFSKDEDPEFTFVYFLLSSSQEINRSSQTGTSGKVCFDLSVVVQERGKSLLFILERFSY